MYSKLPLNRMKKRPHEESTIERPRKSLLEVDGDDGAYGETKVFSMTPPIKMNKRSRDDSGIETPRTNLLGAVHVKDDAFERTKIFKFRVLLPNGSSVELKVTKERSEIPIEEFIELVKKEYSLLMNQKRSLGSKRSINWEYQDLYFTDAYNNKIRLKAVFCKFMPSMWHLLWLHDGSAEPDEYEGMWDLTPDTDLLRELPDDYTCETALADLIDNSLQALWSNRKLERRLVSVEMQPGKISIFDSGPGMDGANGNICKWGKMGASLHRSVREKAIGGEPPYLMPFFGMFGYGGPVATMCLGRRAVVSSKTKESNNVFMLHMEREALVSASDTENCWKTKGGVRDPFKDEKLNSPHGSFTKVEIFDPKFKVEALYARHLRYKLKDIYFPYIQCDEMSGKTSRPVEFKVNGKDLAELQGGEVATTNLHSCNGPDFIVQLRFSISPDSSSMAGQNQRILSEANARLKCVYFPMVEGKESIQKILDKLDKGGCGISESFESFSRVSIRRLGRLLPDTRWALLPFMEPKQKKGEKTHIMKRLCSRVKCFIDTDSGFNPTPHKTDLAHHHPYTKALKNFGNRSPEDEKEVQVDITIDGNKLVIAQLQKLYEDWISSMHDRYDEELDGGLDQPTIIVVPSEITKKLDLTISVLRVHKKIDRKGICWSAGQKIKVLKGACAGCHNSNVYATLEYIILEGLQGEASGEARLICRKIDVSENRGCRLSVQEGQLTLLIDESVVFPIRTIDSEKCTPCPDIEWENKLRLFNQKLPAAIDLLSHTDCQELEINGGLPISLDAGDAPPENVVAVVRPKFFRRENSSKRLDQKFIVRGDLEMTLEIKHRDSGEFNHIYSARKPASFHKGIHGIYIFPLITNLSLFKNPGIYTFSFSLIKLDGIKLEHEVKVRASAGVGTWKVINHNKNELYTVRAGSRSNPLSIACYDRYKKHILFTSVPKLVIKLMSSEKTLAQVCTRKVEITRDKSTMKIKEFFIDSCELDDIRPNYEATLHISTPDEALSVAFPCRVIPGTPRRVTVHPTKLQKELLPGQIIEELLLEVFDEFGNHVKEDESILLKVDANSRVDLSNVLKVSRGYGKNVLLSVISKNEVIFKLPFQTANRELRPVQKVFKNCEVGSLLEDVAFEIIDSEGNVDESFDNEEKHGRTHTLTIKPESFCSDDSGPYSFHDGRCTIPSIPLPDREGIFSFSAVHSRYPQLNCTTKVYVVKTQLQENHDSRTYHADVGNPVLSSKIVSANELIPRCSDLLKSQVAASSPRELLISQKVLLENHDDILQSQVAASSPGELSGSALISQKVRLENHVSAMNHEDVGNPILSTRRSSEHEQALPNSPSLMVSQVMNKTFSPHSTNGLVSDSPTTKTPKHTNAQGGSSDILEWSGSGSAYISPEKSSLIQQLGDDFANSAIEKSGHERKLQFLKSSRVQLQKEISRSQDLLGHDFCKSSMCDQLSTLEQIKRRSQSAAAFICEMLEEESRHQDIVGVVALLGKVESLKLSRMLAQYLGEDQMLAIVCRDYAASYSLESNTLLSINGGYLAFCLEDIRPISKEPSIDPRELLPLQHPTMPDGNVPRGFLGYAVNLMNIEPNYLHWRTKSGHGLRESLFYRLFGKLHVYIDRECMMAAQSCIKDGAVSLDGGMLRGNGLISLGHWEPEILFPVRNRGMSQDTLRRVEELESRKAELEKINQSIDGEEKAWQISNERFFMCRNKYLSCTSGQE